MYRSANLDPYGFGVHAVSELKLAFRSKSSQAESRLTRGSKGLLHEPVEVLDRIFSRFGIGEAGCHVGEAFRRSLILRDEHDLVSAWRALNLDANQDVVTPRVLHQVLYQLVRRQLEGELSLLVIDDVPAKIGDDLDDTAQTPRGRGKLDVNEAGSSARDSRGHGAVQCFCSKLVESVYAQSGLAWDR